MGSRTHIGGVALVVLAALALAIDSADAASATVSHSGSSSYGRRQHSRWNRYGGGGSNAGSSSRPKAPTPDALPGGIYTLELDDAYCRSWDSCGKREQPQRGYQRGLLSSWNQWWRRPACKAPGGALTVRPCSAPAATVNKLFTAPLPRWVHNSYGRGYWKWDSRVQGAAAASSLEVATAAGNATAAAATLASTSSFGSSGGAGAPSSTLQQLWRLYPADTNDAAAWADLRGAPIRIVSASRPAETGACYKYANIAGGACSAAGSEVLAGPDDAPQWVLEQVPGQRGRYYIRQSTCAGAQPRYLGQAPRGAVWQQPKQLTAEQLRWTSYWWQSHRQQNQRARGKWVCPEAGPALYARDARGAATRWKLTLRSAGAPTILSVSQTTTTPSVIRVVVAKAPGPGIVQYRVVGTPASGPPITSTSYAVNAAGQLVFTFRTFQAGMLYSFRAQAGSRTIWGPASAPVTITTRGGVRPPTPTILSAVLDGENLVVELQAAGATGSTVVWLLAVGTPPPNLNVTGTAEDLGGGRLRFVVTPGQGFVPTSTYRMNVKVSNGGLFSLPSPAVTYNPPPPDVCPELPFRCLVQAPFPDCSCTECVPGFQPDGPNPCIACFDPSPGFAGFASGCTLSGCVDGFWLDPAANDFRGGCNLCPDNCASCAVSGAFGACDLCIDGFGPIGENGACAPCASDTCSECRRDDFTQDEYCNVCKFGFTAITPEPDQPFSAECTPCVVPGCQLCDNNGFDSCDRCFPGLLLDTSRDPDFSQRTCSADPGCSEQAGCAYCTTADGAAQTCTRCNTALTNGGDSVASCDLCTQPGPVPDGGTCNLFAENADVACTCSQCLEYAPPFCVSPAGASAATAAARPSRANPAALAAQRRNAAARQVASYKKRRRAGRRARRM